MLNECLQLTLCAALGFVASTAQVIKPDSRVALQTFVFHVALPLLVARGVALQVDFFDKDMWAFVGTFLSMRVVTLAASAAVTALLRTHFLYDVFSSFSFPGAPSGGRRVHPEAVSYTHLTLPTILLV